MQQGKGSPEGYIRIREGKRRDPAKEYRSLQKGYRVRHPGWINGYAGLCFGTGDVYVSETAAQAMEGVPGFREFVLESLDLFEKEKYGDISRGDVEMNTENRWLGSGGTIFGRYGFRYEFRRLQEGAFDEVIRIRTWREDTWISYDSEPDLFLLAGRNADEPAAGRTE